MDAHKYTKNKIQIDFQYECNPLYPKKILSVPEDHLNQKIKLQRKTGSSKENIKDNVLQDIQQSIKKNELLEYCCNAKLRRNKDL